METALDVGVGTELLGRYVVEDLASIGAHGDHWVLRARSTQRPYARFAITIPTTHAAFDPRAVLAFERAHKLLRGLDHPGIVLCRELDRDAGHLFLVCDWVRGQPLSARLVARLDANERAVLAVRLLETVVYLHARRVLHRDLRPRNILVDGDVGGPRPVMIGFHLARYACGVPGETRAAPRWTAPEQSLLPAAWLDFRADLYAVGGLLHLVFAGRERFAELAEAQRAHGRGEMPPPTPPDGVAPGVWTVICGLLQHERRDRYASAEAALDDLRAALAGDTPRGPAPSDDSVEAELGAGLADVPARHFWAAAITELRELRATRTDDLRAATLALSLGRPLVARALLDPPTTPDARMLAARVELARHDPVAAADHARRALEQGADPVATRIVLARAHVLAGAPADAARVVDELPSAALEGADAATAAALAELWTVTGTPARVVELADRCPEVWRPILLHLLDLLRPHLRPRPTRAYADALAVFERALTLRDAPGDEPRLQHAQRAQRAQPATRDDHDADAWARELEALHRAGKAIALEEQFAAYRRGCPGLAPRLVEQRIRLERGQLRASIGVGLEVRAGDPTTPRPCELLAIAHLALGELDLAIEALGAACDRDGDPVAIVRIALAVAVAAGDLPAALDAAAAARARCAGDGDVAMLAGLVWWQARRTADATAAWTDATTRGAGGILVRAALARPGPLSTMSPPAGATPKWPEVAWWAHVKLLQASGWPTEAARTAEEALARHPGSMLLRAALDAARRDG